MSLSETQIKNIIMEMGGSYEAGQNSAEISGPANPAEAAPGVFGSIDEAVASVKESQRLFCRLPVSTRIAVIEAMRKAALNNAEKLAGLAHDETGYGSVAHKIAKNRLAAIKTPGVEDIIPTAYSGDNGLTLTEGAPYGVIGAITPSTNPTSTVINNAISMVSGANGVVFNPHPGAKKASNEAVRILNSAIFAACGISCLLGTVREPSADTGSQLMSHPLVRLLVVTGGEAVVSLAMKSGKKVIAAGPGNPPVIVDETADIAKAAKDIVAGASFDNNVLCIAEKEVFAVCGIERELVAGMLAEGCYFADEKDIEAIAAATLVKNGRGFAPNRSLVGRSAKHILAKSGVITDQNPPLIICRCAADHPFVTTEMLMPVLPIVAVQTLGEAVDAAVKAENGCFHTAIMHSKNVDNLTLAARTLDTTIFVKNGPSYAGLGIEGEGYATLTIATPTGEGLTSAKSFVRSRRCVLSGSFNII